MASGHTANFEKRRNSMLCKLTTAALILTLALALAACGTDNAGTAAKDWTGTNAASQENWTVEQQNLARGPLDERGDGAYYADESGHVKGFDQDGRNALEQAGQDLGNAAKDAADGAKNATEEIANAAKDAATGAGEGAESLLDDATQNADR